MHDLLEALRLRPPLSSEVLIDVGLVAHTRTGITDELPADDPGIAAVHRVREHAFDGVLAQQSEKVVLSIARKRWSRSAADRPAKLTSPPMPSR